MRTFILILNLFSFLVMNSQDNHKEPLPYHQIPEYPESYTAGTVVARMIDGLGFRYYWATEGLESEDLTYKPAENSRTIEETVDHIYGLSRVIYNSAVKKVNDRGNTAQGPATFKEKRAKTLFHLKEARDILIKETDLSYFQVIFKNETGLSEFPFWNQINGPIEDAVWHTGQVVMMRRAAGNPWPKGVSVLMGTKREN